MTGYRNILSCLRINNNYGVYYIIYHIINLLNKIYLLNKKQNTI